MKAIPQSRLTYNHEFDIDPERNKLPSETQPDQNLSLAALLKRYSRGQPIPVRNPVFDNPDEVMPDVSRMDKIELEELNKDIQDVITTERKKLASSKTKIKPVIPVKPVKPVTPSEESPSEPE